MKIRAIINLKTIVVLVIITLILVFFACFQPDPPLEYGRWDQGKWDVEAWGE